MRHNAGAAPMLPDKRSAPSTLAFSKEVAACGICGNHLEFSTGDYGQSLEACSNSHCINAIPHRPQAESYLPKRTRSTSKALRGPAR